MSHVFGTSGPHDPINCPANQPKPTGEWTADYVADRFTIDASSAGHIAGAHNTALAAAFRAGASKLKFEAEDELDQIGQLQQQLADANDMWDRASRQADTLAEYLVDAKADLEVAQEQLAAEREAGVKALAQRSFELHECQKQLTAEQEKVQTLTGLLKKIQPFAQAWAMEDLCDEIEDALRKSD